MINNNPPSSGVGRYAYSLHKALGILGVEHLFISLEDKIFNKTFEKLRQLGLGIEWLYALYRHARVFQRLNISKALAHVLNNGYLAMVIPRLKEQGNKVVVTVHDIIPLLRGGLLGVQAKKFFRNIEHADFIICVSHFTAKELPLYLSHIPRKVIHNGVDHEVFKPRDKYSARKILGLPADKPLILNVGSEEPRKNIPTLLKAFRVLLREIPEAVLIRVGSLERSTARIIKGLGLQERVIYRRAGAEIGYYYNAADVLVHTAYYEGLGFPPLEAMASGTPVVASKIPPISEVVGDAAILVDPFDYESFAEAIAKVLTDTNLSKKLSYLGYRRSQEFSWEKAARETSEVYMALL